MRQYKEKGCATSADKVPSGARSIHENQVRRLPLLNENDWTRRFKKIAADAFLINARRVGWVERSDTIMF